jgi:ABC-type transporter Mla subunit MlaD
MENIKSRIESFRGKRNEVKVGVFVLIPVIIIIVFLLLKLGYSLAVSTMDVYVKVDSMKTVKKGTPVQIKGYELGRVVKIEPVYKPALHFLATIRIRRDVELYEDCRALIMNQGVIGDPVVELRNPEKKGAALRPGDVMEGIEAANLEEILKKVNTLLADITTTVSVYKEVSLQSKQNLRELITSLSGSIANVNNILANSQQDIIEIFRNLQRTSRTLDEVATELKKNPMRFLLRGKKD